MRNGSFISGSVTTPTLHPYHQFCCSSDLEIAVNHVTNTRLFTQLAILILVDNVEFSGPVQGD